MVDQETANILQLIIQESTNRLLEFKLFQFDSIKFELKRAGDLEA